MNTSALTHKPDVPALEYTGERMVPEAADRLTFWDHVYRYAFACRFAAGKRILDIACGEGYGTAALEKVGASSVIGVDISDRACAHARDKYGVDARTGSAEQIPLVDHSVDLVVSFETIEHVPDPRRFLGECARVLAPGGRLIVSTPNKDVYSGPGSTPNPFHCSEMTEREFVAALGAHFCQLRLYTQHPVSAAVWSSRIFAAEEIPPIRGVGRLRRSARFRLFPRAVYDPTEAERQSAADLILSTSRTRPGVVNPYAVRPMRFWHWERPTYLVAVASRKAFAPR
jgi:2-polyprenyl-3-methyl-5-hydroxy-6-metoxy-1,4-benzoquinol methylase